MADMMKGFVEKELEYLIKEKYPHMQHPAAMRARVIYVSKSSRDTICTIRIIDKNNEIDERFPEVPYVETKIDIQVNDLVVILMMYGACDPYIVGRC